MNKTKLKHYAPPIRKDSIAAVTARANLLRLSSSGTERAVQIRAEPVQVQGDVALVSAARRRAVTRRAEQKIFEGHAVSRSLQGK